MGPDQDDEGEILSLAQAEETVTLELADGTRQRYVLRECSGEDRDKYLNDLAQRMGGEIKEGAGIRNFKNFKANLIAQCIMSVDTDSGEERPVPVAMVAKWPGKVQDRLFAKSQRLSGLNEGAAEDAEKN